MSAAAPERLDPADHDWMRGEAARAVIAALCAARPDGARFVGGCVRNALMGEPVADIDIATQLTPDRVIEALDAAGIRSVPTGIAHGTVTAVQGGEAIEITTLRRDVSTDGRRASVAFTEDWAEDSARRDFRFNAIYCAPDGVLFDPQGGAQDARARRVVFIGDADSRIAEDALRILRFFRLHAQLGRGRPDRDGLLACARGKERTAALSGERIWAEMKKLLGAPAPEQALRWMQTADVLRAAIGVCDGLEEAAQLAALRRERDWPADPVLMLAALAGGGEARAKRLAMTLKMSRAERDRLRRAARITCADSPGDSLPDAEKARATAARLYRDGAEAVMDEARLCWARARADAARAGLDKTARENDFARQIEFLQNWTRPEFPLSGKDLKGEGFAQGKAVGQALEALERDWIASDFTLGKDELMHRARALPEAPR